MVQKYNKTTAFCLVLLVASSEIVHVEMTVEQQLEVAESDWNIVKDAFTFISLQESDPGQSFTAEKEDARKTLKIPPPWVFCASNFQIHVIYLIVKVL